MARVLQDTRLGSRTARAKLPLGRFYAGSGVQGVHLGYAKSERGGNWFARLYRGDQKYKHIKIAVADDFADADGARILNFADAQARARELYLAEGQPRGPMTVEQAADAYLQFVRTHRRSWIDVESRIENRILPMLGTRQINDLTLTELEAWMQGMVRADTADEDAIRASKDSANRTRAVLRAALSRAYADSANGIRSDEAWRRLSSFKRVSKARETHLSAEQCQRLINATSGAFRDLVVAALLTGARRGELVGLSVRDFHRETSSLAIRDGKTGPRTIPLNSEALAFFEQRAAGRKHDAPLLPNAAGTRWGPGEHIDFMRRAVKHARLPDATVFYSLRHSYISLALLGGLNILLLSQITGTSVAMIQAHYGKFDARAKQKLVEEHGPRFGLVRGNVRSFKARARSS